MTWAPGGPAGRGVRRRRCCGRCASAAPGCSGTGPGGAADFREPNCSPLSALGVAGELNRTCLVENGYSDGEGRPNTIIGAKTKLQKFQHSYRHLNSFMSSSRNHLKSPIRVIVVWTTPK